jgi:hypothetical protein
MLRGLNTYYTFLYFSLLMVQTRMVQTRNKLKFDELDKLKRLISERRSNKKIKNKNMKYYYCYLHSILYLVRKLS